MPDEEFKLVTSKRKAKRIALSSKSILQLFESSSETCSVTKEAALRRIEFSKQEVLTSDFYSSVLVVLRQGLDLLHKSDVGEILCYGLGHFTECMSSRYQLALLLLLKEHFQARVFIYDPIFTKRECECLNILGFELITTNEEGKRIISSAVTTLVYMPHCPKQMTNNFLWANWGLGLTNCLIVGNSFSKLVELSSKHIIDSSASFIFNILPYSEEFGLVNSFKYRDIFNDTSIHVFPLNKINLTQDLWNFKDEPNYCVDDIEYITKNLTSGLKLED